jgi:tape measure domain-containing protein
LSDSLAGLAINVNVQQVLAATKALEALALKAVEVDKKVANLGGATSKKVAANNRTIQEETRVVREIEKANKQQLAARKISAEQTIAIERAKMNTLLSNNERYFSAMNLAEGRRMASWQKFQDKINSGLNKEAAAQQKRVADISRFNGNLARMTEEHYGKLDAQRKRDAASAAANNAKLLAQEVSLEKAIQASRSRVSGITGRANRQLPNAEAASVIRQAVDAQRVYEEVLRKSGVGSLAAAQAQGNFARAMQNASGEIARQGGLLRTLNNNASALNSAFGGAGASLGGFGRIVFQTSAALASLAGAFALREITQTIMEFERFSNTLRTVSGSSVEFSRNMTFLISESNRIGFSIGEVGNSFARLSLAMQGAGFTGDQTRTAFTQLAEASRNFGLSSADTMGVIRALEQSMSKGKFMAEEVRLQLGDRLPVAMAALERAVTKVDGRQSDINKRFEEGSLDVQRYGEEFIRQINIMSGGAETLARTQNTIAAAFGRLGTQATVTAEALGEAGFSAAVIRSANSLSSLLEFARQSGVIDVLGRTFSEAAKSVDILAVALTSLAGLAIIRGLVALAATVATISPIMLGATAIVGALTAAYALLGRNTPTRATSDFTQATSALLSATDRASTSIGQFNAALATGGKELTNTSSAAERAIAMNVALGNSHLEAAQKYAQAELRMREADLTRARALQAEQQRALGARISSDSGVSSFTSSSGRRLRELNTLDAMAGGPVGRNLRTPEATQNREFERNQILQVQEIVRQAQSAEIAVGEVGTKIRDVFREIAGPGNVIPGFIQNIIQVFEELARNPALQQMSEQAELGRQRMQALEEQIVRLRQQATDPIVLSVSISEAIFNANGAEVGFIPQQGATNRPRIDLSRLAPVSPGVRILREAAARTGMGSAIPDSITDYRTARARFQSVFQNQPGAAEILSNADRSNTRGNGGGTNRVQEAMRDLQLQAGRAGIENGTAETAYAEALKRVADAADLTTEAFQNSAQAAEVRRLVAARLNKEMELAIRLMAREAQNNGRVAAAYLESNEAGRQMENTIRAEAEARKYARETGVEYAEALRLMTIAVNDLVTSEQNLGVARQMREGRNEIEVLELEGRLITSNVAARNAEVAVLRMRQQFAGADEAVLSRMEDQIRRTEELRSRNEQLTNSWNEVSRLGEQAFERIGSAITEALAQGKIQGIDFKNVMKAVFSEIAQAALKLAVINPILNSLFGGTRGTLGGVLSVASSATGSISNNIGGSLGNGVTLTPDGNGGFNINGAVQQAGQSAGLFSLGRSTGLGSAFTGGAANTGYGFIDGALNANIFGTTPIGTASAVDAAGRGLNGAMLYAPGTTGADVAAGGLNVGGAIGGAASIAGGAYGIYSGLQKGGIGGGTQVAGGALSAGLGAAALAGMAVPVYGWIAAAILSIAGALLPGQKPSGQGQLARTNLNSGLESFEGLGGKRFSQANRDAASNTVDNIVNLVTEIGNKLGGARIGGDIAVGTTNSTLYLDVNGQKGQYSNSEEGAKQLADAAAQMVLNEFRSQNTAPGDYRGIVAASGTLGELNANLQWYEEVYKTFNKTAEASDKVAEATKAVVDQYNPLIDKAHQLGLSSDELVKARERDWQAAKKAVEEAERARLAEIASLKNNLTAREAATKNQFDYEAVLLISSTQRTQAWAEELRALEERLTALGVATSEVTTEVEKLSTIQGQEYWANRNATMGEIDYSNQTRILRAQGLGGSADWMDFERAAKQQVDNLRQSLAELGVEAWIAAQKISETEQAIEAERQARIKANHQVLIGMGQTLQSRLMRANGDTNGADLLDFEANAAKELSELPLILKNLGATAETTADIILKTEATIGAERVALQKRIADEIADNQKEAAEEAARAWETFLGYGRNIRGFINAQNTNSGPGGVSTAAALAAAQSQFDQDLVLARGGNEEALQRITQSADTLLTSGREQFASGTGYQNIRSAVLTALESLPATRSYDAMILEELRKLGGGIDVSVDLEVIRVITESLNALPASEASKLVQAQIVARNIEEKLGRVLTSSERDSLATGGSFLRTVEQVMGRNLSVTEREGLVIAASVRRTVEQSLGRTLTPAEMAMLVEPGFINRTVRQNIETIETVQISRSIDDKLSGILNAQLVIGREQLASDKAIGTEANNHTRQIMGDMNNLWRNAAGVGWTGGLLVRSNYEPGRSVVAFAKGGVVDGPVNFPMSGGRIGLMGEAGTEGIFPLQRMPNGDLGVQATGSGSDTQQLYALLISEVSALREDMQQLIEVNERTAEATEDTAATNARMVQRDSVAGARARAR